MRNTGTLTPKNQEILSNAWGPLLSLKYEEVYLKAYDSVKVARASIRTYLTFYNSERTHQSLDGSVNSFL